MNRPWMFALALVAGALLVAAPQSQAQEMTPEVMAAWAENTTPGEHHQVLNGSVGKWEQKLTMWMAPDAPPMESTSTSTAAWSFDGRWMEEDITGTFMGMPFQGRSLMGYDNFRDEYVSIFMDNMSTAPMIARGTYDPATRTFTLTGTMDDFVVGTRDIPFRQVSTITDDTHATMEMFAPGPDGNEFLTFRVEATKVE
ncbi:MAG TPA: DUF1579 domain-containing protein [Gemmatimonadota bacterium]|nr:DUF1579 domain-containing protein [Gemmatimonadota bacterium]